MSITTKGSIDRASSDWVQANALQAETRSSGQVPKEQFAQCRVCDDFLADGVCPNNLCGKGGE